MKATNPRPNVICWFHQQILTFRRRSHLAIVNFSWQSLRKRRLRCAAQTSSKYQKKKHQKPWFSRRFTHNGDHLGGARCVYYLQGQDQFGPLPYHDRWHSMTFLIIRKLEAPGQRLPKATMLRGTVRIKDNSAAQRITNDHRVSLGLIGSYPFAYWCSYRREWGNDQVHNY